MTPNRPKEEIIREIISKHPLDLTNHELCWLCLNVFFGEENHLGIFCIRAVAIKTLELYQQFNSPFLREITNLEEFLKQFDRKVRLATPRLCGLQRIDPKSGHAPKYMKDILLSSGLCPYTTKRFNLYTYSAEVNRYVLEKRFGNGCSAPRCAICHGAALKKRIKTYLKVAAMLYSIDPVNTLKTIKTLSHNPTEYWDGEEINPEFVHLVNTQAGLPKDITKDDAQEILEEIVEELE